MNASRPSSEHPPVRGENVKTFVRWDHRLQRQNLFVANTIMVSSKHTTINNRRMLRRSNCVQIFFFVDIFNILHTYRDDTGIHLKGYMLRYIISRRRAEKR